MVTKPRVFISYSSRNKTLAETIERTLTSAGFEAWRDKTRLETDWSREIAQALAASDIVCLVWTEDAQRSKWVNHEWLSARALGKAIVPCFGADAPSLPLPLSNIEGVALTEPAGDLAPVVRRFKHAAASAPRYDYTVLPSNSYLPFNPNPHFVGRDGDLLELYLAIIGNLQKIGVNHVGCVGMGGLGKTQLAIEFAYRFSFGFDGVFWLQAADRTTWRRQLVRLAKDYLALPVSTPESPDAESQYLVALQKFCRERPRLLLVMDNVVEPATLNTEFVLGADVDITPLSLGCDLLFTTRRGFEIPGVVSYQLTRLAPAAALTILTRERTAVTPEEMEDARAICSAVGYLPLALALAASYLKKYRSVSFRDYREELARDRLEVIDIDELPAEALATRHETAVTSTLKSQWAMLTDENARHVLKLAAAFDEATIVPLSRLKLFSGIGPGKSKIDRPFDRALSLLTELSLLESLDQQAAVRVHPLIRAFVAGLFDPETWVQLKHASARHLIPAYEDVNGLVDAILSRTIDEVLGDLDTAAAWSDELESMPVLAKTRRLLDRERHHIRKIVVGAAPSMKTDVLQQLHYRAARMGQAEFAARSLAMVRASGNVAFQVTGVGEAEDAAIIRTLQVPHDPEFLETSVSELDLSWESGLALTSGWRKLTLWDLRSGKPLRNMSGHTSYLMELVMNVDGRSAWTVDSKNLFIAWDLDAGTATDRFSPSLEGVVSQPSHYKIRGVSIDRGLRFALIDYDNRDQEGWDAPRAKQKGVIVLLDLRTKQRLKVFRYNGHDNSVCLDVESRRVFTGDSNTITLWDLDNGNVVRTFSDETNPDCSGSSPVALSPDGSTLLSVADQALAVWEVETGRLKRVLRGHADLVGDICLSGDGRRLLSATDDHRVILWDLEEGAVIRQFFGHAGSVSGMRFAHGDRVAVSGSSDGALILWDVAATSGAQAAQPMFLHSLALDESGTHALGTSGEGGVVLLSADGTRADLDAGEATSAGGARFVENGKYIVFGTGTPGSYDTPLITPGVHGAGLSADGRIAVLAHADATLSCWDLRARRMTARMIGHTRSVRCVAVTGKGDLAVSGADDGQIILWDLARRQPRQHLETYRDTPIAISVDADGRYCLTGTAKGTATLWNLDSGRAIRKFPHGLDDAKRQQFMAYNGSGEMTRLVALSGDAARAILGFVDDQPVVWDLTFDRRWLLRGHDSVVTAVGLAPDGSRAVTGSVDRSLILWDVSTGAPLHRLFVDGGVSCLAFANNKVVFADSSGRVQWLELVGLSGNRTRP